MSKVIHLKNVQNPTKIIKTLQHPFVLIGGCFDILHIGHVKFFHEVKKRGESLVVLLESDAKVKLLKGPKRPFFTQDERAFVLASISDIDVIINLPLLSSDSEYQDLIKLMKPNVIAYTENDPKKIKKFNLAKSIKAKIRVVPFIKTFSSSSVAKVIGID